MHRKLQFSTVVFIQTERSEFQIVSFLFSFLKFQGLYFLEKKNAYVHSEPLKHSAVFGQKICSLHLKAEPPLTQTNKPRGVAAVLEWQVKEDLHVK